jgi:hypothetical protein
MAKRNKKTKKTADKTAAKTENGLNHQQELFCQLYIGKETELFGNGAQCYMAVYGKEHMLRFRKPMSYIVAASLASRMLTKVNIIERINALLETGGFNNENVDKQHLFLINQHADLKTKMAAIKEFNELKQRVKKKLELTGSVSLAALFDKSKEQSDEE